MKSNLFFPWPYHFYLHNSLDVWLVFWEDAYVTYEFKNIKDKTYKESERKLLKNSERRIETISDKVKVKLLFFSSLDHGNWCLNQEEKANSFPILVSKLYTDI